MTGGDTYCVFAQDSNGAWRLFATVDAAAPERAVETTYRVSGRHARLVAFLKSRSDLHPDPETGRLPAAADATLAFRGGGGWTGAPA